MVFGSVNSCIINFKKMEKFLQKGQRQKFISNVELADNVDWKPPLYIAEVTSVRND